MRPLILWLVVRLNPRVNAPKWGLAIGALAAPYLTDGFMALHLPVPDGIEGWCARVATAAIGAGAGWLLQKGLTLPRATSIDESLLLEATDNSVRPEDGPQPPELSMGFPTGRGVAPPSAYVGSALDDHNPLDLGPVDPLDEGDPPEGDELL